MIKKARKKPVVVNFCEWTGDNYKEIREFAGACILRFPDDGEDLFIYTREGRMKAPVGYKIMEGVEGEFYPCDPGIFEKTYEVLE